jgi:chromosome segregation ATPase
MRRLLLATLLASSTALTFSPALAQDADTETRLRDALRSATTQLRDLQDDQAQLQAKLAESQKQNEALQQQVQQLQQAGPKPAAEQPNDAAAKAAEADHANYEQAVAEFNRRLSDQNDTISKLEATLEKWKGAYDQAANVARAKEAERAKLAAAAQQLNTRATTCETKNDALFKVANEILDRFAKVGFGDVLASREPFIGFKRVELENIVQNYQDKVLNQKASQ